MDLILERHSYSPTETMGTIVLPDGRTLHTIERPWKPDPFAGSKPFESCIPDGPYQLVPHNGREWQNTWAMVNPALMVYQYQTDLPGAGQGRYACLLHPANWARNVVGCIGPGLRRCILKNENAVASSTDAMNVIRQVLGPTKTGHRLIIQPALGARLGD